MVSATVWRKGEGKPRCTQNSLETLTGGQPATLSLWEGDRDTDMRELGKKATTDRGKEDSGFMAESGDFIWGMPTGPQACQAELSRETAADTRSGCERFHRGDTLGSPIWKRRKRREGTGDREP